jgi:hypothetical protein
VGSNDYKVEQVREILREGANPNFVYRGRHVMENAMGWDNVTETLQLLISAGSVPPHLPLNVHCRDMITIGMAFLRPDICRVLLQAPAMAWQRSLAHVPSDSKKEPEEWQKLPPPVLSSLALSNFPQAMTIPACTYAGMGRTMGVDGGPWRAHITREAVEVASVTNGAIHLLPFLIFAYSIDIETLTILPPATNAEAHPDAVANSPWPLNTLMEHRDPDGYNQAALWNENTGDAIHRPLRVTTSSRHIPCRIIDIAPSIDDGKTCVKVTNLSFGPVFDEWFVVANLTIRSCPRINQHVISMNHTVVCVSWL